MNSCKMHDYQLVVTEEDDEEVALSRDLQALKGEKRRDWFAQPLAARLPSGGCTDVLQRDRYNEDEDEENDSHPYLQGRRPPLPHPQQLRASPLLKCHLTLRYRK